MADKLVRSKYPLLFGRHSLNCTHFTTLASRGASGARGRLLRSACPLRSLRNSAENSGVARAERKVWPKKWKPRPICFRWLPDAIRPADGPMGNRGCAACPCGAQGIGLEGSPAIKDPKPDTNQNKSPCVSVPGTGSSPSSASRLRKFHRR